MQLKKRICMALVCMFTLGAIFVPVNAVELNEADMDNVVMNHMSFRVSGSFNMTVPAKSTLTANKAFPLAAGETVTITASYSLSAASMDFGLVAPDGSFYYFNETDGSVDRTIQVDESGNYTFQVRNHSDSTVDVSGFVEYFGTVKFDSVNDSTDNTGQRLDCLDELSEAELLEIYEELRLREAFRLKQSLEEEYKND